MGHHFVKTAYSTVAKDVSISLRYEREASDLRKELQVFVQWELRVEVLASVRCASFIAQSVVNLGLTQSNVASGHFRWLDKFFVNERSISG
ncbi:hypothetical protein YC2023_022655 [Brassica napus]